MAFIEFSSTSKGFPLSAESLGTTDVDLAFTGVEKEVVDWCNLDGWFPSVQYKVFIKIYYYNNLILILINLVLQKIFTRLYWYHLQKTY